MFLVCTLGNRELTRDIQGLGCCQRPTAGEGEISKRGSVNKALRKDVRPP